MKKNYILTLLFALLFSTFCIAQVSYAGNGNSGFGDVFGSTGSLEITDDGTQISLTLNRGAGDLNNTMIIYIDSKTGGFSDTSSFTDTGDGLRKGISGYDGTNRSTVNFPAGFEADYVIALDQSFAGLWTLVDSGSHTYIDSANLSPTATPGNSTFTFNIDFTEIGTTSSSNFKFVVTYLNDGNAFRSDEAIGDGISSGNPGATAVTFTGDRSYPNTWTGATDTSWTTANNWSQGVPTTTHNVYIPVTTNQPSATASVTINKATIASGASLISSATFTGTIQYNLTISDTNWHLISSPVVDEQYDDAWNTANSINVSGTGDNDAVATYINTSDADGDWVYFQTGGAATTFDSGTGYSLKRTASGSYNFAGTFNDADTDISITANDIGGGSENRWNLIGNPYPSFIDIAAFLTANGTPLTDTHESIYVWNGTAYEAKTTGYIHPGQGFFVNSNVASTTVSVTEAMQSHQTGVTFYKSSTTGMSIDLSINDGSTTKSTKILYQENKTTGLDPRFDIGTFTGQEAGFSVYTHLITNSNGINFMRQALPNSGFENMIIPVGIKADANTEITFSAEALNLPTGIKMFLEDKNDGSFIRLDEAGSKYTVAINSALNGIGRFYLHTKTSVLAIENLDLANVNMYKTSNSNLRIVGLQNGNTTSITMFDLLGRKVHTTSFKATTVNNIPLPALKTGIYIISLATGSGKIAQKIIIE